MSTVGPQLGPPPIWAESEFLKVAEGHHSSLVHNIALPPPHFTTPPQHTAPGVDCSCRPRVQARHVAGLARPPYTTKPWRDPDTQPPGKLAPVGSIKLSNSIPALAKCFGTTDWHIVKRSRLGK